MMNLPPPGDVASLSLDGKTVLVTGATRGIGRGIALAMAKAGAEVVVTGRGEQNARDVVAQIAAMGGRAGYLIADLEDDTEVDRLVPRTVERFGRLDVLVNNAGIGPDSWAIDYPLAQWRAIQRVNLEVPFRLSQAMARHLFEQGCKGSIVNISSILGQMAQPMAAAYTAAKHGLNGLTKALAIEWASRGVRVNAIAPGLILTNMTAELQGAALEERVMSRYPAARPGYPLDIGGVAVFLVSDAADFVHGQIIVVDGGRTAGAPPAPPAD